MEHVSVLKKEVRDFLDLKDGEVVVDCTLGLAGHALDILSDIGENGTLLAFDQDERNLAFARERLRGSKAEIKLFHDNFCYLKNRITEVGIEQVDAILMDLGLSSPHVDDAERGFSFVADGPLDMRFDQRAKLTAADVVNAYSEDDLANIFYKYGEEKYGRKIARRIVERRKERLFTSTADLAELVKASYPQKRTSKKSKSHPATQVFQALRIEVNDELKVLEDTLEQVAEVLKIGGRVVIISYHSLEDRIVKQFFKALMSPPPSPEQAIYQNHGDPYFETLTKKPLTPSAEELESNPRSRSAKLRVYKKIKNIP